MGTLLANSRSNDNLLCLLESSIDKTSEDLSQSVDEKKTETPSERRSRQKVAKIVEEAVIAPPTKRKKKRPSAADDEIDEKEAKRTKVSKVVAVEDDSNLNNEAPARKRAKGRPSTEEVSSPAHTTSIGAPESVNGEDDSNERAKISLDVQSSAHQASDEVLLLLDTSHPYFANLPQPVIAQLDLWIRWLILFLDRLFEVALWSKKSDDLMVASVLGRRIGGGYNKPRNSADVLRTKNWENVVLRQDDEPTLLALLNWAEKRNVRCHRR
jgi:hypothetical protein